MSDLNLAESYREISRWGTNTDMAEQSDVLFVCGASTFPAKGEDRTMPPVNASEQTIKIKAGYVYYLKVAVAFMGAFAANLEYMPHKEGADMIAQYELTIIK